MACGQFTLTSQGGSQPDGRPHTSGNPRCSSLGGQRLKAIHSPNLIGNMASTVPHGEKYFNTW